jgi:hypothetical protein
MNGIYLLKAILKEQQITEGHGARSGFYGPPLIHTRPYAN